MSVYRDLTYKKTYPPSDPDVGLCLGSKGGPRKMGVLSWVRYPCAVKTMSVYRTAPFLISTKKTHGHAHCVAWLKMRCLPEIFT